MLYVIHCFPATYTIMMHRTATILGQWAKIEGRVSPTFYNQYVLDLLHLFLYLLQRILQSYYKCITKHSNLIIFRWNSSLIWPFGAIVRHGKGDLYKAEGDVNCAEPGNSSQSRFYRYTH